MAVVHDRLDETVRCDSGPTARSHAATSRRRLPGRRGGWRFAAGSAALHGVVLAVLAATGVPSAATRTQATVTLVPCTAFELPPDPDDAPPPAPDVARPEVELDEDDPPPLEPDWEPPAPPATLSVTDLGADPLFATPRAVARPRRACPGGAPGGGSGPAATATASPEPPAAVTGVSPDPLPRPTAARLLDAPHPAYPDAARDAGIQGTVVLEADVDEDGAVTAVRVAIPSGSDLLDRAAAEAVRRWRFAPATCGGAPVATTVRIPPIRFRLDG
jgi:periplasmic protein TonB